MIETIQIRKFVIQDSDIHWNILPDVNFLVGNNGCGKSTILSMIAEILKDNEEDIDRKKFQFVDEFIIKLSNNRYVRFDAEGRTTIGFGTSFNINSQIDVINSFDGEEKLTQKIESLKGDYFKFYGALGDAFNQILTDEKAQKMIVADVKEQIFGKHTLFVSFINQLFEETDKNFLAKDFEFKKKDKNEIIKHEDLSSGEKQAFLLLLTCLLQNNKPSLILLDEPEISMHIEWQQVIIKMMRELNPNCQIIVATHSYNLFINGWGDRKKGIYDITVSNLAPDVTDNVSRDVNRFFSSRPANIFDFNKIINEIYSISLVEAKAILKRAKEFKFKPDTYTYTILVSKVSKEGGFSLIKTMEEEKEIPNIVTYNGLLKKMNTVSESLELLKTLPAKDIKPDIISFSTILGKARTSQEVEQIEELRQYFKVQTSEMYESKLKLKR